MTIFRAHSVPQLTNHPRSVRAEGNGQPYRTNIAVGYFCLIRRLQIVRGLPWFVGPHTWFGSSS